MILAKILAFFAKTMALGMAMIGVMVMPAGAMQIAAGTAMIFGAAITYSVGAHCEMLAMKGMKHKKASKCVRALEGREKGTGENRSAYR